MPLRTTAQQSSLGTSVGHTSHPLLISSTQSCTNKAETKQNKTNKRRLTKVNILNEQMWNAQQTYIDSKLVNIIAIVNTIAIIVAIGCTVQSLITFAVAQCGRVNALGAKARHGGCLSIAFCDNDNDSDDENIMVISKKINAKDKGRKKNTAGIHEIGRSGKKWAGERN
jgi:hypothetical protein